MTYFRALGEPAMGSATQRTTGELGDVALGSCGCLMTFHRAAPADDWAALPDRNFYVDLGYLDRLLAYLAQTGRAVVTMEEVTARVARNAPGHRYVNFSVDDGYRDTIEQVVPLFRRHGVPITIFVTTGIPDGTLSFWRSGLEIVLRESETVLLEGRHVDVVSAKRKRLAYSRIAAAWDGVHAERSYAAFCDANGWDPGDLHSRCAVTWEMLESVAHDPCVEIGAHTVSHPHLAGLSPEEVLHEMTECRARLIERLGVPVRHFAFPYGRAVDCGKRDFEIARRAGYASASTTRKGLIRGGRDPFGLPRNTLNGSHRHLAFAKAHLIGLSGVAARVLGRV